MQARSTAYLGLGTNLGDREAHLRDAIRAIAHLPGTSIVRESSVYTSAPWGPIEQPDFLNMVIEVSTGLEPDELLRRVKGIERALGRREGVRWGPRPIDIDILLYGNRQVATEQLQVPHARLWERAFVLRPLSELRPDLTDPSGRPIIETLNDELIASQGVWPYARQHSSTRNEQ